MRGYDIFISYRRQGGEATARILCERFTDMGYKVFFDVESLRSGDFNKALYDVIDGCSDFLMVLSPGALDRCENEDDWVRNELAFALSRGKNVVPVMLRGFFFPPGLPADIDAVRFKNGLEASVEFFDAFVDRLRGFLKSRPAPLRRVAQNTLFKRTLPFFIALLVLCAVIGGGFAAYRSLPPKTFPYTQAEKNIAGELLADMQLALYQYNTIVSFERGAYEECAQYLSSGNPVELENAIAAIDRAIAEITKIDLSQASPSADLSNKIDNTPVDKAVINAFFGECGTYKENAADSLRFIKFLVLDSVLGTDVKKKIVSLYTQNNALTAKYIVYTVNGATLKIDRSFLSDFKKTLALLTSLPYEGYIWIESDEEIQNQLEINLNKMEDIANQLTSILGDQNIQYANEIENYRIELTEMGLSREQIDDLIAAVVRSSRNAAEVKANIQKLREEIMLLNDSVQTLKEEARVKFAPLPSDDEDTIWGKMLRFLTLDMKDDAIAALNAYDDKVRSYDTQAAVYIPAAKAFIRNIGKSGIDYGAMVLGFEPGKTAHEIYEIGDVVVAVNDVRCLNAESYINFKVSAGDRVTILRYRNNRPVFTVKTAVPNQSKALFISLTEREDAESSAPLEGLDDDRLWELMTEKIADFDFRQAVDCAQIYQMRVRGKDSDADSYVPALISFIRNIGVTGINYGALVTSASGSAGLNAGDVIIAVDGRQCLNSGDYEDSDMGSGGIMTVMRRNAGNGFDTMDIPVDGRPGVTVRDIGKR